MTVEEKRKAIENYCGNTTCDKCPLYETTGDCFNYSVSDERINDNYAILFGITEDTEERVESTIDPVNRPAHYNDGKIEVIDYIEDKKLGFCLGNAIKYISRAGKKDPDKEVEDLNKAIWYINRRIKEIQEAIV